MADNHDDGRNPEDSAIFRLRWVTDAMEAARRYAEQHPGEVAPIDPDVAGNSD